MSALQKGENISVVIITNYWKNSAGGGVKTYLVNLVEELQRRGIKVSVIFREGEDSQNTKINGNKLIFSLKSFLTLRKVKPQVVHSQGTWYCLLPSYLYKKLYGARLIHTFHTEPDKKLPVLGKVFVQMLLNGCDCVTFVSKGLQIKIEEIEGLKFKKTAITYAGVQSKEVSEKEMKEFRERFNIKEKSLVLLAQAFTANKLKAEGAKLLIKSVKKLRDKYPNLILILTREGSYSNKLKEFAKNEGIEDNVIFTGDLENPYLPLVICDIYTHTPIGEGLPLALLEAMSMRKPIIATSVGGIPEAIENGVNGILVEPDVDKIAEKIEYLLENREFAEELGRNAKKTAEATFTWEKAAEKFIEIYSGDEQ